MPDFPLLPLIDNGFRHPFRQHHLIVLGPKQQRSAIRGLRRIGKFNYQRLRKHLGKNHTLSSFPHRLPPLFFSVWKAFSCNLRTGAYFFMNKAG
jgi:hypothetical protein